LTAPQIGASEGMGYNLQMGVWMWSRLYWPLCHTRHE